MSSSSRPGSFFSVSTAATPSLARGDGMQATPSLKEMLLRSPFHRSSRLTRSRRSSPSGYCAMVPAAFWMGPMSLSSNPFSLATASSPLR